MCSRLFSNNPISSGKNCSLASLGVSPVTSSTSGLTIESSNQNGSTATLEEPRRNTPSPKTVSLSTRPVTNGATTNDPPTNGYATNGHATNGYATNGSSKTTPSATELVIPQNQDQPESTKHLNAVICTRPSYYTIPSLEDLSQMVTYNSEGKPQLIVDGFTIGRRGRGNVFFPDRFDIYGINIDKHVHFGNKELTIYQDDNKKPPVGEGLNRPAQITLDEVFPRNKGSNEFITEPSSLIEMGYENILRNTCQRYGTTFVDYRNETGSWVFEVPHFTR